MCGFGLGILWQFSKTPDAIASSSPQHIPCLVARQVSSMWSYEMPWGSSEAFMRRDRRAWHLLASKAIEETSPLTQAARND